MLFKARPDLLRETVDDVIKDLKIAMTTTRDLCLLRQKRRKHREKKAEAGEILYRRADAKPNTNFDSTMAASSADIPALDNIGYFRSRRSDRCQAVRLCDEKMQPIYSFETRAETRRIFLAKRGFAL